MPSEPTSSTSSLMAAGSVTPAASQGQANMLATLSAMASLLCMGSQVSLTDVLGNKAPLLFLFLLDLPLRRSTLLQDMWSLLELLPSCTRVLPSLLEARSISPKKIPFAVNYSADVHLAYLIQLVCHLEAPSAAQPQL